MAEQKILVLGSGMVAKPCVDFLLRRPKNTLTIACRTLPAAAALAGDHARARAIRLDATSDELDAVVAAHDVVISLVPFVHHPTVIRSAIKGKTHVVTTSYVSPALRELEEAAVQAGITVLNEVGVDPGVDHLYAVKTIGEVHDKGGKVKEFYSYCGGLPAPEVSHNPLRFKFSWSPRGALLSQFNSATFLKDGVEVTIPNEKLMASAQPYHVIDGYSFVAYPNRNSVPFRDFYNIPEARTVIRGSLRYEGNPALVAALIKLGWLSSEPTAWLEPEVVREGKLTWAQAQQQLVGATSSEEVDLIARVNELCTFSTEAEREAVLAGLRWMGLFSNTECVVGRVTPLDTLSGRLEGLCSFQEGERDLVMLQHKFVVEWADGSESTMTSTLELLGDPYGYSAMAKSVGVTCGIATQLLLDGNPEFARPGVLAPYERAMCAVLREGVEREGITLIERVV